MSQLFEAATRVYSSWALAAFAIAVIAAIVFVLVKRRGKLPAMVWGAIAAVVLLGLVPIIVNQRSLAIYRVRVIVVGPQGAPVDDAKVWSLVGASRRRWREAGNSIFQRPRVSPTAS